MSRVTTGNSSTAPTGLHGTQGNALQPLPPRSLMPNGALVSLADPLPANSGNTLEIALPEKLQFLKAEMPKLADPGQWRDAVDLVLELDQRDATSSKNPITCQIAAKLLLSLGQGRLLCRLAQFNQSVTFELEVGFNAHRAEALKLIGKTWPPEAAVSLVLDAHLPPNLMLGLRPFMQCPLRLSLHVKANGKDDLSAAHVMGQVVGHRPLEALSLDINVRSVPVLQGLCGVKAKSILIVATGSSIADAGSSVFLTHQIAEYQGAAVDLVRHSGTQVLRLPQSQRDEALCARLLAIRSKWDTVAFSLTESPAALEWLSAGQQTIGRLELHTWSNRDEVLMSDLLAMAAANRVHTIVIHDTVTLRDMADGLETHAKKSAYLFDCIEANFTVATRDEIEEASFEKEVLVTLLNNPTFVTLRHRPLAASDKARSMPAAVVSLGNATVARLDTMSSLNRTSSPEQRNVKTRRALEKLRVETVKHMSDCLSLDGVTQNLVIELVKLSAPLVQPKGRVQALPVFAPRLKGAFEAFEWFGVEVELVKRSVALCVFEHPTMGPALCQTLLSVGLPRRQLAQAEWAQLGERYRTTWLSGKAGQGTLKPIALPMPDVPPGPVSALSAVAPGVAVIPAVGRAVPVVQEAPSGIDILTLVRPGTQQKLDEMIDRTWQRVAMLSDANLRLASVIITQLLERGIVNAAGLRHPAVANEVARQLLEEGQGGVLRHIIGLAPRGIFWTLNITSETMAQALYGLGAWPKDDQCGCILQMHADLPIDAVAQVVAFATTLAPQQLTLRVLIDDGAAYEGLASIVHAKPGLTVLMEGREEPDDVAPTIAFLNKLQSNPLRGLGLIDFPFQDSQLVDALVAVVEHTGVRHIDVLNCSPVLTERVLKSRSWEALRVECGPAMARLFELGLVSTKDLYIRMSGKSVPGGISLAKPIETMLANCRELTRVSIEDGAADLLAMARGLNLSRTARSAVGVVSQAGSRRREQALQILQRNPSLRHLDLRDEAGRNPRLEQGLLQLQTHYRMRSPGVDDFSVGQAFGLSMGGGALTDVGAHIGNVLLPRDFLAFAKTSKAAYAPSRLPWEAGIDRLAAILTIANPDTFKTDLFRELSDLDGTFAQKLPRPKPTAQMPASTLLEKVAVMQSVYVPELAIGEALGRALNADPARSQVYLEAMVTVGAYPAEAWLKDIMGIDVQAVVADMN